MQIMDLIRRQVGADWSQENVENARFDDFDSEALAMAREFF